MKMKRTITTLAMMLIMIISLSAQKIIYWQDEMTDEYFYIFESSEERVNLMVTRDMKEGIVITPAFEESAHNKFVSSLTLSTLIVRPFIIEVNCVEEAILIIKFVNGERITLKSFNKWNCDPQYFFAVTASDREKMYSSPIDKIMLQDGRSYKSYTHTTNNPKFFLEIKRAITQTYVKK